MFIISSTAIGNVDTQLHASNTIPEVYFEHMARYPTVNSMLLFIFRYFLLKLCKSIELSDNFGPESIPFRRE